jgi:hypothetical protein
VFLRAIYARRGDEGHLASIRNDKFDLEIRNSHGYDVVLPSLWGDVIVPEMIVRVTFWLDNDSDPVERSSSNVRLKDRVVSFASVEVDRKSDNLDNIDHIPPGRTNDVASLSSGVNAEMDGLDEEESDSTSEEDEEEDSEPPPVSEPV